MEDTARKGGLWGYLALAAVAVVIIVAFAAGNEGTQETEPIKFGAIAPLTGDAASYGVADQHAKMLAVEEINAAGGIDGRQIEVVWEDSKCNGTDGATAVQKLINVDQAQFVLADSCSGATLAELAITEPAGVFLLSGLASSPDLTIEGDHFFRTYPSDAFAGRVVAAYATKDLGAETVAIISEKTDYAQGLRKSFMAGYTRTIMVDESYDSDETDFRTIATKVKEANVDAVYVSPQTPATGLLVLKQLQEAGVTVQILTNDAMLDRGLIAENKGLYEGVISPEVALDETNARTKEFVDGYTAKYGVAPEYPGYLAAAYDSVYLLAEAMAAGNWTPDEVKNYFETQIHDWPGAIGTFNFDAAGDAVLGLHLRKVVDGEVTDLGPYAAE